MIRLKNEESGVVHVGHSSCTACSADAYDDERLSKEEKRMEVKRARLAKLVENLSNAAPKRRLSYEPTFSQESLKAFKKEPLEAIKFYIENQAEIYKNTTISSIIQEMLVSYHNYLKEYHLS